MNNLKLLTFLFFILLSCQTHPADGNSPNNNGKDDNLALSSALSSDVLGVLAPMATSPLVGITFVSGISILAQKGIIEENSLTRSNKTLGSYWLFSIFLLLALSHYAVDHLHGFQIISKLMDWIEDNVTIVAVVFLVILSGFGVVKGKSTNATVSQAGFLEYIQLIISVSAIVISVIVIQTVRFFLGILALLLPIPYASAIFSTIKNFVTTALMTLYIINPFLALVCNIILFLICISILRRAYRSVRYFKAIYLKSLINKILKRKLGLFTDKIPSRQLKRIQNKFPNINILIPVFPIKKIHKIKKKSLCYLINSEGKTYLYKPNIIKKPFIEALSTDESRCISIGYDIFFMKIFDKSNKSKKLELVVSNDYRSVYGDVVKLTGFYDVKEVGLKKTISNTANAIHNTSESVIGTTKSLINQSKMLFKHKDTELVKEHI